MRYLGKQLKESLPDKYGYCLLVFPFYNSGMANYVSTANRADMIKCLREAADRLERKQDFQTPNDN